MEKTMLRQYLFLILCVGGVIVWGITSYSASRSPFALALEKGRHQWSMHQPATYKAHVTFYGMEGGADYWVTVRNGIVVDTKCSDQTPDECLSHADTIPELFDVAEDMYKQSQWADAQPVQVHFTFDPIYGYPQSMTYSSNSTRISDFWAGMKVTEFEVLPLSS
jgi:hypothetical protein